MKKLLILLVIISSSCSFLDLEPKTQWSGSNMPTELNHLEGILRGGYQCLGKVLEQGFITYGDERADVYYTNNPSQVAHDLIIRNQLNVNMPQSNWRGFYEVIKQANLNIHYVPILEEEGKITQSEADIILGQAYCQRAYAYFWIVRIWGDAPIIKAPLLNANEPIDLPRSSIDDVFIQIHSDLDLALKHLPAQATAATVTRTLFSAVAARAIKAHAYMWEHKYAEALEQLNLAIPTSTALYRLASLYAPEAPAPAENAAVRAWIGNTEFSKMFNTNSSNSSPESIFELAFNETDGDTNNAFDSFWTAATTTFKVRTDMSNIFSSSDYRYYASITPLVKGKANACKWVIGYIKGDTRDIVLIRLADLKLLRAEARIMLAADDPTNEERTQIMTDINDIITRAQGPKFAINAESYLNHEDWNKEMFLTVLKLERQRELAFEGQRWFDLIRWGDTVSALASMKDEGFDNHAFETGPVALDSRGIVWPVYIEEVRRSKYIVQTPFYQ